MARLMDLAPAPVSEPRDADDYEVLRQLAKGGMGTVMEARDLTLRRTVAMKVMDRTTPGQAHDRFDREARVLARLDHPNIVPIHAMGRDPEGRPFYTMKLVRGETLQAILNQLRKGSLRTVKRYPLAELLGIFQKVGQAVAFAHSRGVIHRDLKPENIMVGEFGEVLVMDWGLAKVAGESETSGGEAEEGIRETSNRSLQDLAVGLTLDGAVMGTPQFMSPEQASGRITELDTRSDIFSLGAILYAILTLRPPVRGGSVEEVLAKVRSGEIVPPTLYNHAAERPTEQVISLDETTVRLQKTRDLPHCPHGRVPEALSAVTMRAMALQTGERYQTVTELLAEIESYLGGFATSVEKVGALGQLWLLMKRHQVVSALLGVMLVLSAGFMAKVIASEGKARRSAELATKEALNARQAETRAVNEATNARLAEASARRSLAESRIALADAALRDRDAAQMRRHLTSVSEDHRNEDWHYLNRSLRPALGSIPAGEAKLFHDVKAVPGPAGELIASSRTGDVLVIQATTRSITRRIRTGLTGPLRVAMSADASLVAVARDGGDGYRVFDYRTGTLRHQLPTAGGEVFSLSFAGPGAEELFVVERQPNQGRKLRLADGKTLWSTPMGLETAVAPAGQFIAAHYSNAAQDVRLIDAKDGSTLRKMDAEGERSFIWQLDFSPDGKLLAAGDHLGDVHLWEVATGRLVQRFNAGVGRLQGMAFGPADTLMTLCEEAREDSISPRSLRIWNYRSMAEMASFIGLDFEESRFAYSQQANVVMTRGPRLNFYPVPVGKEQHIIPARSDGRHVSFLGETNLVAGTASSFFGLYALAEAPPPRQVWTAPDDTFAMGVSGDGRRALLASRAPRYLQGYQLTLDPSGRLDSVVTNLLPHAVWAAGLSHNGQIALLAGKRGDVQFYDVAQNQLRGVLHPAGGASVKQLRFCADDQRAVTLSQGTREAGQATDILTLWDLGRRHAIVEVTNQFVCHRFALNPDQQRLALVGTDLQVRIYDTATLTLVRQFRAHNKSINDVAFHPTKPVLATASDDMSVKLWDLHTGEMIEHFIGPARPPLSLAFSPSGQLLAAGCADKTTRVWLVRALSPVDTAAE